MSLHTCRTLFIEDAARIDAALYRPEEGVTGQSWHLDLQISGEPDDNTFIYDFSTLKKLAKRVTDQWIDHSFIICTEDKGVALHETGDKVLVELTSSNGEHWSYRAERSAFCFVPELSPNLVELELEIAAQIQKALPSSIKEVQAHLREQVMPNGVFLSYTHGLYNYEGLCQRIFHGHRGLVQLYIDGEYSHELSQCVVEQIIGPRRHIACTGQVAETSRDSFLLAAKAPTDLQARVPQQRATLLPLETSIESLTEYCLKSLIEQKSLQGSLELRMSEGIGKVAICRHTPA